MARLRVPVTPHDHVRGPDDAAVTLIEYGDYECEHCVAAYDIVNAVQEHFGNDLRFVFRHFPLTEVHPHAEAAASIPICLASAMALSLSLAASAALPCNSR